MFYFTAASMDVLDFGLLQMSDDYCAKIIMLHRNVQHYRDLDLDSCCVCTSYDRILTNQWSALQSVLRQFL